MDGVGVAALFNYPWGITVSGSNLLLVEYTNQIVRCITISGAVVTTYAGTGVAGYADGPVASATFNGPLGIAVDAYSHVYVSHYTNSMVRMISEGEMLCRKRMFVGLKFFLKVSCPPLLDQAPALVLWMGSEPMLSLIVSIRLRRSQREVSSLLTKVTASFVPFQQQVVLCFASELSSFLFRL